MLIESGYGQGKEFNMLMQGEARQAADYIGKDLDAGLGESSVGAGHGSTRQVIVEKLDTLRGGVLLKALSVSS